MNEFLTVLTVFNCATVWSRRRRCSQGSCSEFSHSERTINSTAAQIYSSIVVAVPKQTAISSSLSARSGTFLSYELKVEVTWHRFDILPLRTKNLSILFFSSHCRACELILFDTYSDAKLIIIIRGRRKSRSSRSLTPNKQINSKRIKKRRRHKATNERPRREREWKITQEFRSSSSRWFWLVRKIQISIFIRQFSLRRHFSLSHALGGRHSVGKRREKWRTRKKKDERHQKKNFKIIKVFINYSRPTHNTSGFLFFSHLFQRLMCSPFTSPTSAFPDPMFWMTTCAGR